MIPRTFPSTFAANGQQQMVVYSLPSITGLTAWIDYIPVKGVTTESATLENTYANGGYQVVNSLASLTGKQAWLDYIPVYEDASYTKPWSTDAGGYIPTSALAALLLDFTSGRLDPRITFSRTTNATLTNSAGLVAYAPMNLLTFSEQFDNAAWTKIGATLASNSVIAPDGAQTADTLVEDASTGNHWLYQSGGGAGAYSATVYAKAAGRSWLVFRFTVSGTITYAWFNVSTGALGTVESGLTATITAAGNGWYRCSISGTMSASSAIVIGAANANGSSIYTGNSGNALYLWGAQLELGSTATTYNPTTVKNLLGFTENFDNAAWTKSNASISATKVDDIYGQPFAQQVTSSAGNGTVLSAYTAVASTPYTFSIWMKRVTGTGNIDISADGSTWATQTLTTEWQRFSVTVSPTAGSKTPGVRIATSGDSIYIFGAQLSDSASVDPYVYQPVAAPSSVAYYGPRFDYDPVTLAPKGLLIEEQRTNLLLYSQEFDNAAWTKSNASVTANAAVAPDGTLTGDKLVENTATSTHLLFPNVAVTLATGVAYAYSVYAKAAERSICRLTNNDLQGVFFDVSAGTVTSVDAGFTGSITSVGNGWYRLVAVQASNSNVSGRLAVALVSTGTTTSYTGNGTSGLFIWGAQLE